MTGAVDVGPSPSHLAADGRTLWITNADGRSVSRVDLDIRSVRQTVTVGSGPAGVALAAGAVWVANSRDGTVSRIDLNTNTVVQRIHVGTNPTGVAAGAGAIWVANSGEQTITRIDPRSGRATTIDVHAEPTEIAVGRRRGLDHERRRNRTVSQLDPRSGHVVQMIPVGGGPSAIAVGHGAVWVANSLDGTVSRIAPSTGVVARRSRSATGRTQSPSGAMACGSAEQFGGVVDRIDPATNRVAERIPVRQSPEPASLVAGGTLWVGARAADAAHRGGTLRVLGGPEGFDFLDPASPTRRHRGPCSRDDRRRPHRVQRAAGRDGTQIVPDLAVTLPRPQDGGRTYRFVLRTGIHYSTGGVVRARDVRPSFERLWKIPTVREVDLTRARVLRGHRRCRALHEDAADVRPLARHRHRSRRRLGRHLPPHPRGPRVPPQALAGLRLHPARRHAATARPTSGPCRRPARTWWPAIDATTCSCWSATRIPRVVAGRSARRLSRSDRTAP